jgi:hypothetical protein
MCARIMALKPDVYSAVKLEASAAIAVLQACFDGNF